MIRYPSDITPVLENTHELKPENYRKLFEDPRDFDRQMKLVKCCLKDKNPKCFKYCLIKNGYRYHRKGRMLYRDKESVTMFIENIKTDRIAKTG